MKQLESGGVCIAILDDGGMRVLITEQLTLQAIDDGGVIYSPQDVYVGGPANVDSSTR
jgi:hypothetical protein